MRNTSIRSRMGRRGGFTLVEVLVVMAIIGLLIAFSTVAYRATKEAARDAKRRGDLQSVRSALELYRTDCRQYPAAVSFGSALSCSGSVYMSPVPQDPRSPSYAYRYEPSGTIAYSLCAYLEQGADSSVSLSRCSAKSCGDATCNYEVQNP